MSAPIACSWSGGKDSALALHLEVQAGGRPHALLTMLEYFKAQEEATRRGLIPQG